MRNVALEQAVEEALEAAPGVDDPLEIAVATEGADVVLRGTVASYPQRRAAGAAAATVPGVRQVRNELTVDPTATNRNPDDELRGRALQAILDETTLPSATFDVQVADGWVTLQGRATSQEESDAAFLTVSSLRGVAGVTNEMHVGSGRG